MFTGYSWQALIGRGGRLTLLALIGAFVLIGLRFLPAEAQVTFTEIAASAGVTTPGESNGSSVVDFDGDGLEDLVLVSDVVPNPMVLYHNNGDGTFSDVTSSWPGLPLSNVGFTSWADFDNDGDADVVIGSSTHPCELRFFRNNRIGTGEQSFTLIQTIAFPTGCPTLAAWGDFDNDGDLDVFVGIAGGPSARRSSEGGYARFRAKLGSALLTRSLIKFKFCSKYYSTFA